MPETNLIKQICTELNITQKQLAEKMGVAEQTVRHWSSKKEVPDWAIKFLELIQKDHNRDELIFHLKKVAEYLQKME